MDLLSRTRRISKIFQKNLSRHFVDLDEVAQALCEVIGANIYIVSPEGSLLGVAIDHESNSERMQQYIEDRQFPEEYVNLLSDLVKPLANEGLSSPYSVYPPESKNKVEGYTALISIIGNGDNLGTLILSRLQDKFTDDDMVLGEYGATVSGMEILREHSGQIEEEARSRAVVQLAVSSLSYSELEAAEHIFGELEGLEGLLVASKIADRVGITRSVIVNALRKLESAGVVESRSLGMKGTYIKILNPKVLMALEKARH